MVVKLNDPKISDTCMLLKTTKDIRDVVSTGSTDSIYIFLTLFTLAIQIGFPFLALSCIAMNV